MSAEHTSRFITPLLRWLRPDISDAAITQVQFFVRKTAHLTEYAVLAMLLWRAFRRNTPPQTRVSILFLVIWCAAVVVAASDEFHQSFVASRTAAPGDVIIDSGGAMAGLIICAVFAVRKRR
ncbi:MAG: VanZ family protein [Verrucomicrobiota bacterium]